MHLPNTERRIIVALILLLVSIQATVLLTQRHTNQSIARQSELNELTIGGQVFERLMSTRSEELERAAKVLSADFGVRSALATGERATIESMLLNHGQRLGAVMVAALDVEGQIAALVPVPSTPAMAPAFTELVAHVRVDGLAGQFLDIDGALMRIVVAPVRAPHPIGWLVLGFAVDDVLATDLKSVSGLEVSILSRHAGQPWQLRASTVPTTERKRYLRAAEVSLSDQQPWLGSWSGETFLLVPAMERWSQEMQVTVVLARSLTRSLRPFAQLERTTLILTIMAVVLAATGIVYITLRLVRPLSELAFQDSLTGLANRTLLNQFLQKSTDEAQRTSTSLAVLMMDLDRFKVVNDTLGHDAGDELLREVAVRLRKALRNTDFIARQGGDEFVAVLPNTGPEHVEVVAHKIATALDAPMSIHGKPVDISASIGIALQPDDASTPRDLLRLADSAMFWAKRYGLTYARWSPECEVSAEQELSLLGELRRALAAGHLEILVQPLVALRSSSTDAAEALIRWRDPDRGLIPPQDFIPFAESTGFMRTLTRWVLAQSLEACRECHARGHRVRIGVNVTPRDLADSGLPRHIACLLQANDLTGEYLCLEMTEKAFMEQPERVIHVMQELRSLGVHLAVDDFGTGFASLDHIRQLPVTEIKIDRSFIQGLPNDPHALAIVNSAIELGRRLSLRVIAEGVEDEAALDTLSRLGCDMAQGFHLCHPLPLCHFLDWLDTRLTSPPKRALMSV